VCPDCPMADVPTRRLKRLGPPPMLAGRNRTDVLYFLWSQATQCYLLAARRPAAIRCKRPAHCKGSYHFRCRFLLSSLAANDAGAKNAPLSHQRSWSRSRPPLLARPAPPFNRPVQARRPTSASFGVPGQLNNYRCPLLPQCGPEVFYCTGRNNYRKSPGPGLRIILVSQPHTLLDRIMPSIIGRGVFSLCAAWDSA